MKPSLEDFRFDYDVFYEKLLIVSRQGFQLIKERYPNESFYCFAFYSHGDRSFIYTAASTEEGLTRVAQRYIKDYPQWYGQATLEEMRAQLRHSVADSPVHEPQLIEPLFQEINDLLWTRSDMLFEIWSRLADEIGYEKAFNLRAPHDQQFLNVCFAVLKKLDAEGVFGKGPIRQNVVLNFVMGDQSEEKMLSYAAEVNPVYIVQRYQAELEVGYQMYEQIRQKPDKPD